MQTNACNRCLSAAQWLCASFHFIETSSNAGPVIVDVALGLCRHCLLDKKLCHLHAMGLQAMPYIKDIVGVGLARGIPNWKRGRASHTSFGPVFMKCKNMGLHLTAHAGKLTAKFPLCSPTPCSLPLSLHHSASTLMWYVFDQQPYCQQHHAVIDQDEWHTQSA